MAKNSHQVAMAWSLKHVAAKNTKAVGSQVKTVKTAAKPAAPKPATPSMPAPQGW